MSANRSDEPRSVGEAVRRFFDGRPEYAGGWPVSVAPLIARTVPLGVSIGCVEDSVKGAIRSMARKDGKNAIKGVTGTVYVDPIDLPFDTFLTDYCVPQRRRIGADVGRLKSRIEEYARKHSDLGFSAEEIESQVEAVLAEAV